MDQPIQEDRFPFVANEPLRAIENEHWADPGFIIVHSTNEWSTLDCIRDKGKGDLIYEWEGGPIAKVSDNSFGYLVDAEPYLPFKLDWVIHDDADGLWYVRNLGPVDIYGRREIES